MGKATGLGDAPSGAAREPPGRAHTGPGIARTALALLLLSMAAGQASDLGGFSRVLDSYRVFPGGSEIVAAGLLLTGEIAGAFALLGSRRGGDALALGVALAWTALAAQAFARGLVLDNCGCFGVHLGQPLRWWVLLQDAYFVGLAAWVRRAGRR